MNVTTPKNTLADARYMAIDTMKYLARAIVVMDPVEKPGIGTFAVDKHWRMYYDPACFEKWTLMQLAGVVIHECFHLIFEHHSRFSNLVSTPTDQDRNRWNIAADMAINSILRSQGIELPPNCVYPDRCPGLPNIKFENGLSAEKYWNLLENEPIPSEPNSAEGSSGTDGHPRDFEDEAPEEGEGISETDERRIKRGAVKDIKDSPLGQGIGASKGDIGVIIERILEPAVNPAAEIFASVKYAVNTTAGWGSYTYKRPNPRQPPGAMRLPVSQRPIPEVRVLIDTSASMTEDKDLALAAGIVGNIVNALPGEGVLVYCADTQVQDVQKVFSPTSIRATGRGGTRMDTAIVEVDEDKTPPDVIVCITDGETGWPSKPTRSRLIICLTRNRRNYGDSTPSWAKTILVSKPGE